MKLPNTVRPDLVGSVWRVRTYCPSCADNLSMYGRQERMADHIRHLVTVLGIEETEGANPCPFLRVRTVCQRCGREDGKASVSEAWLTDNKAVKQEPKA